MAGADGNQEQQQQQQQQPPNTTTTITSVGSSSSSNSNSSSVGAGGDLRGPTVNEDNLASASDNSLFSLKWNEFDKQLALGFGNLYHTQELADVTLCCDGKSAQAHKIILAMCSPYFRQIFKEHPCQHPVVIIKGINSYQLQLVLQFIYFGQVSVEKREIQNFIEAAELLKIDGISSNEQSSDYGRPFRSASRPPFGVGTTIGRHPEQSARLTESMLRSMGGRSSYPSSTATRANPPERWNSSGTPEMLSPASGKVLPDTASSVQGLSLPPRVLSSRRYSSRSSDGSGEGRGVYSSPTDPTSHLTSVIRNPQHMTATSWTTQPRVSKEGLTSPKLSPPAVLGIPVSSPPRRDFSGSGGGTVRGTNQSPFLEPPLPVMVSIEEPPEDYGESSMGACSSSGEGGVLRHPEGEYELSIQPIPGLASSPYSKTFRTSSGIVSASLVKSSPRRLPSATSPPGMESDPLAPEVMHALAVVPAKKRFSHLTSQGLRYSPVDRQDESLVIRPVFNPLLRPPISVPSSSSGGSGGYISVPMPGIIIPGNPGLLSSMAGAPSKIRAHRQSQVPQSARYTSAQVDAIVDSVNEHSGPCVPCKICDKWVKRERLRAHIHECHLVHGEKIICPHCGVALKSKGSYRVHVWRHRRGVLARGLKTKRVMGQRPKVPSTTQS